MGVTLHQRSGLPEQLGVEVEGPGEMPIEPIEVDSALATTVDGIYAAGDACTPMPSVANAIAAGSTAAASIVHSFL